MKNKCIIMGPISMDFLTECAKAIEEDVDWRFQLDQMDFEQLTIERKKWMTQLGGIKNKIKVIDYAIKVKKGAKT